MNTRTKERNWQTPERCKALMKKVVCQLNEFQDKIDTNRNVTRLIDHQKIDELVNHLKEISSFKSFE